MPYELNRQRRPPSAGARWILPLLALLAGPLAGGAPPTPALKLAPARAAATDLEWRNGGVAFLSLAELRRLPVVRTQVRAAQENFLNRDAVYRGVLLRDVAKATGVDPSRVLLEVKCIDGFTSYFTPDYVREYSPLLIFEYNGLRGAEWPKGPAGHALGPYAISYRGGTIAPQPRAGDWRDEPLRPSGIVSITVRPANALDAVFRPPPTSGPAAARGYATFRGFCIQCHADRGIGGSPGPSVEFAAEIARRDPVRFRAYVKNPQAVHPDSQMEGRPGYSPRTLDDLLAFYRDYAARHLRGISRSGALPSGKGN